jgi:hypothetical protein
MPSNIRRPIFNFVPRTNEGRGKLYVQKSSSAILARKDHVFHIDAGPSLLNQLVSHRPNHSLKTAGVSLEKTPSLQQTSNYSDLTIVCGDDIHRVHKAIVCPCSEFFTAACKHGQVSFLETNASMFGLE